jgi:2-iminoacetate synthase ThiH
MQLGLSSGYVALALAAIVGCSPAANPVANSKLPNHKSPRVKDGDALVQFSLMAPLAAGDDTDGS